MSYAETILPEFDQEMASTRKVLERVPEDKLDWQAHPKSNTIGWNAGHLAEIPGWVKPALEKTELDLSPPGGEPYKAPDPQSRREILETFDKNVAEARKVIEAVRNDAMNEPWSLLYQGNVLFTMPRFLVV